MTPPPDGPQSTTQDVDAWLLATAERHAAIHLKAARSGGDHLLHEAFVDMSVLFLDAFEEVRMVSAQLREESQDARAQSSALRHHRAQLLEQSVVAMQRLAQFLPPPPEAVRQAESHMLEMFREGQR